ncbi:MAG: hypothetical protein WBP84_01080, partial [Nitrososphaeraceae archaeon]
GIPIFNALRFIMNINATKLSEIIAPTRAKAGYRRQHQIQSAKNEKRKSYKRNGNLEYDK